MNDLVVAIVSRTRDHPDIVRGASVRGAIAFKEVLQSFKEMPGGVTRSSIENAALITLPSRISTKQGSYESAVAIVSDIVNEVLSGIQSSRAEDGITFPEMMDKLSLEEIMRALQNLEQVSREQNPELDQEGQIAIIPSDGVPQEGEENQYSSTKKAIAQLMEELEQKLRQGEITEDEYHRQKGRLEKMLSAASQPRFQMSSGELAETVMELMDAQDRQWGKEISLQQMFIYYHIKSMGEGKRLSPAKRDYYGIRALIDDLEKQGILRAATPGRTSTLTAEALNTLLEHLIPKARSARKLEDKIYSGKEQLGERKHDIRRYILGDVFRDISVRHTLKEIARQKKKLPDIARRDFRVFTKERYRLQSDIVLCVDTSGSMGFRHKLIYARLAAAGLVRAAVESGDRVGIIAFDDLGRTIMPLSDWKEELVNYIAQINAGGNTNIGDGIQCATQLLLGQPSRNQKYIVLITDSQPSAISQKVFDRLKPTEKRDVTEEYAIFETKKAASRGIKVSVIHVTDGKEAGEEFSQKVANAGRGQVVRVHSLEDLRALMG